MFEYDHHFAKQMLTVGDPPFYALIIAAMIKADSTNLALLKRAFPSVAEYMIEAYRTDNTMTYPADAKKSS